MTLTAADIMTKNVKTVRPDASVAEIARLLSDNEISAVPVCDAQGQVVGMLSEGDLLRPVGQDSTRNAPGGSICWRRAPISRLRFLECISVENQLARNLMVAPVITASPATTVPELADLLGAPSHQAPAHPARRQIRRHRQPGGSDAGLGTHARRDRGSALNRRTDMDAMSAPVPQHRGRVVALRGPVIDVAFEPGAAAADRRGATVEWDQPGLADRRGAEPSRQCDGSCGCAAADRGTSARRIGAGHRRTDDDARRRRGPGPSAQRAGGGRGSRPPLPADMTRWPIHRRRRR